MGADERFTRARLQRERDQFDAGLAMSMKAGDERALPMDRFGSSIRPGDLIIHTPTIPPAAQVMGVSPVLDPRMPAGAIRIHVMYEMIIPAGQPIQEFFLMGTMPKQDATTTEPPPSDDSAKIPPPPPGPKLVLTDVVA